MSEKALGQPAAGDDSANSNASLAAGGKASEPAADEETGKYTPPKSVKCFRTETETKPINNILIIGSGVFGLSTALALTRHTEIPSDTSITIVDRSPEPGVFPARDASSIDSSRIIRADYADPAYVRLAAEALVHWRRGPNDPNSLGGSGRYNESGLLLVAEERDDGATVRPDGKPTGLGYTKRSWVNALMIAHSEGRPLSSVRLLPHRYAIGRAMGTDADWADWGYLNLAAGWADAERSMQWLHEKVVDTGRVTFVNGTVETLETETSTQKESKNIDTQGGGCVTGARLSDGRILSADLVIVAAGAWTPSLVDLSGQAVATGQCVAYLRLTEDEQAKLAKMPVSLNLTDGCFVIPPRDCVLKIGRHAYGYLNPQTLSSEPLGEKDGDRHRRTEKKPATVSKPRTHLTDPSLSIPAEGETDLRRALRCMIPWPDLAERPFFKTRLCWYTDTATGDWIIDYHPSYENLFIATGGSGHAFKFLPILGDKVVDCLMGRCPQDFRDKWKWKGGVDRNRDDKGTETTEGVVSEDLAVEESISTEDGSRGGKPGQILEIELAKSGRTSLHLEANGNC